MFFSYTVTYLGRGGIETDSGRINARDEWQARSVLDKKYKPCFQIRIKSLELDSAPCNPDTQNVKPITWRYFTYYYNLKETDKEVVNVGGDNGIRIWAKWWLDWNCV